MTRAQAKHGDLFEVRLGLTRLVVLNHPDHIDHVLRGNADNYPKEGVMWDGLRSLLGNGLIISQGDFWRRQRRMMQPHFHRTRLAGLVELMSTAIEDVIERWDSRTCAPVNMNELCPHMTMNVIVRAIFGTNIDPRDVDAVGDSLALVLSYILRGMMLQALPGWVPLPGGASYRRALGTIDDVVYRMIERRRREPLGDDMLSMLIQMVDEDTGERMDDRQLHDEVINMFLAGYETTATGMAWAFHVLATRPDIAHEVREEVLDVVAERRPAFEDLPRLRLCRMVIQEAFRLYPPAWQIMRVAQRDDVIGGYHIPAGSQLMLSFYGSHRHPDVWPSPTTFDPQRFSPEREGERSKTAWMPFGAGQRQCIGKELSLMESSLILAMVAQRYRLVPVPGRTPEPSLSLVLTSKDGVWLQLERL